MTEDEPQLCVLEHRVDPERPRRAMAGSVVGESSFYSKIGKAS